MSAGCNEVWEKCRDEGDPGGRRTQTSGQALTHLEVFHFCSEAKNSCSTPHGPFTLIVLLGVKPCVQKLEGNENERRGLFDCIPEDRKVILNLAFAEYQGKTSRNRTSFAKRQMMCRSGTRGYQSSYPKFCPHRGAKNLLNYYLLPSC